MEWIKKNRELAFGFLRPPHRLSALVVVYKKFSLHSRIVIYECTFCGMTCFSRFRFTEIQSGLLLSQEKMVFMLKSTSNNISSCRMSPTESNERADYPLRLYALLFIRNKNKNYDGIIFHASLTRNTKIIKLIKLESKSCDSGPPSCHDYVKNSAINRNMLNPL